MRKSFLGLLLACVSPFTPVMLCQTTFPVEPGLVIPNDDLVWALDKFGGADQLVPVHHSSIDVNNHTGANIAGALSQSLFYKPKFSTELPGVTARSVIHDQGACFYFRDATEKDDDGNPNARSAIVGWEILRAVVEKNKRVFQRVRVTALTNQGKRDDMAVDSDVERLPGGWTKITPKVPLEVGEYALAPIFKDPKFMSSVVFDFSLDPAGPNPKDVIVRTEPR